MADFDLKVRIEELKRRKALMPLAEISKYDSAGHRVCVKLTVTEDLT
jgi:hypothetical protein